MPWPILAQASHLDFPASVSKTHPPPETESMAFTGTTKEWTPELERLCIGRLNWLWTLELALHWRPELERLCIGRLDWLCFARLN